MPALLRVNEASTTRYLCVMTRVRHAHSLSATSIDAVQCPRGWQASTRFHSAFDGRSGSRVSCHSFRPS